MVVLEISLSPLSPPSGHFSAAGAIEEVKDRVPFFAHYHYTISFRVVRANFLRFYKSLYSSAHKSALSRISTTQ